MWIKGVEKLNVYYYPCMCIDILKTCIKILNNLRLCAYNPQSFEALVSKTSSSKLFEKIVKSAMVLPKEK